MSNPSTSAPEALPRLHYIDRQEVTREVYEARRAELTIDESSGMGETVVLEDGSYGGASETFSATDANGSYTVTEGVTRGQDGTTREFRSITRDAD